MTHAFAYSKTRDQDLAYMLAAEVRIVLCQEQKLIFYVDPPWNSKLHQPDGPLHVQEKQRRNSYHQHLQDLGKDHACC